MPLSRKHAACLISTRTNAFDMTDNDSTQSSTEMEANSSRSQPDPAYANNLPVLKRRASWSFATLQPDGSSKRKKDASDDVSRGKVSDGGPNVDGDSLVERLAQELQCGCCSELVYRPVIIAPCEHFFCGRCVQSTWPVVPTQSSTQLLSTLDPSELLILFRWEPAIIAIQAELTPIMFWGC